MYRGVERRQFGRRSVRRHAWIKCGGLRIACVVLNLSEKGAYLDFGAPVWLPLQFKLVLGDSDEIRYCELRHTGATGVGVNFVDSLTFAKPEGVGMADVLDNEQWRGGADPAERTR